MVNLEQIMPILIALIGSAGMWAYFSARSKHAHEQQVADRRSRDEFSQTLKDQIGRLSLKLDDKTEQIEQLLKEIAELRAELSAAKVTIAHLESILRAR